MSTSPKTTPPDADFARGNLWTLAFSILAALGLAFFINLMGGAPL
jgi:hypothetical protein